MMPRNCIALFAALAILAACGAPAPSKVSVTDKAVVDALKTAGLPIGETIFYTAETDPHKLLGRPNQYIAKASWRDNRLPPSNRKEVTLEDGGIVEIYADTEGANNRAQYLEEVGEQLSLPVRYDYVHGPIVLRLSKKFTPDQARQYEQVLRTIPLVP